MVGTLTKVLPMLCWVLLHVAHSRGNDEVSVEITQSQVSVQSSDIKSCLSSESLQSFRVRFQKLKGKTATFTRTLLNKGVISTFASGMKTANVANIDKCVHLADAGGFVGFSFNNGTCDMFNIKPQTCGCEPCGQDVFYVQESYWAPKGRPGIFELNLVHGMSSITAEWRPCDPVCFSTPDKFHLSWNNKLVVLDNTTFNYTFDNDASLCTSNLSQMPTVMKEVTLKVFDEAGTLRKTVTATLADRTDLPGKRYLLNSSNCLYYDEATRDAYYDRLETFCRTKLNATMFIAYVYEDFITYRGDLLLLRSYTPPVEVFYHYIGLRREVVGTWTWLSGLQVAADDVNVWEWSDGIETCVQTGNDEQYLAFAYRCVDWETSYVCHLYLQ